MSNANNDAPAVLSELEQLVAQAEAEANSESATPTAADLDATVNPVADHPIVNTASSNAEAGPRPSITVPATCIRCKQSETHVVCPICCSPFCEACGSILDPRYCKQCLNEPMAELVELPLKDADGVTHEGRRLQPSPKAEFFRPRFGTLAQSISQMSMYQLEAHIQYYKELVRQAERTLDFRRVVVSGCEVELAQRQAAERRALRADKKRYTVKTVSFDKTTGKAKPATASMMQMLEMLKALDKLKSEKKEIK